MQENFMKTYLVLKNLRLRSEAFKGALLQQEFFFYVSPFAFHFLCKKFLQLNYITFFHISKYQLCKSVLTCFSDFQILLKLYRLASKAYKT